MNFTDDELRKIEDFSGHFLSYEEIAVLLNKDIKTFLKYIKNIDTPAYAAYLKGKTLAKYEIRKNIIKLAKFGNHNAEQLVNQFIIDQEVKEV